MNKKQNKLSLNIASQGNKDGKLIIFVPPTYKYESLEGDASLQLKKKNLIHLKLTSRKETITLRFKKTIQNKSSNQD